MEPDTLDQPGYDGDTEQKAVKAAYIKHLQPLTEKREPKKRTRTQRQRDAIARLFHGKETCAAIRYSHERQEVDVASNAIYVRSKKTNTHIRDINEMASLLSNQKIDMKDVIVLLSNGVAAQLQTDHWRIFNADNTDLLKEQIINQFCDLFKSGKETKRWRDQKISELAKPKSEKDIKVLRAVSRMARDFIKIRRAISKAMQISPNEAGILQAIANKKLSILKLSEAEVHAEMRIIDRMIAEKTPITPNEYVGISRLCCPRCALVVDSLNINTAGHHPNVGRNWALPNFFKSDNSQRGCVIGNEAAEHLKRIPPTNQAGALSFITNGQSLGLKERKEYTFHDSSDSDDQFGISDEENEVADLNTKELFQLQVIKEDHYEEYFNLLRHMPHASIAKLYKADQEGCLTLGSRHVARLVSPDEFDDALDFDELLWLYHDDRELFDYFIRDENDLISQAGPQRLLELYKEKLAEERYRLKHNIGIDDIYPYDVDAKVKAEFESEEGLESYDNGSDDSQSRDDDDHTETHRYPPGARNPYDTDDDDDTDDSYDRYPEEMRPY